MTLDQFLDGTLLTDALWQSTACLVAGLALSAVCAARPARAHALLLACMVSAILAPLLSVVIRTFGWGLLTMNPAVLSPNAPLDQIALSPAPRTGAGITLPHFLAIVWALMSAVMLLRLARAIRAGRRLVRSARPLDSTLFHAIVGDANARFGSRHTIEVRASESIRSPLIWCWGRVPQLILPATMTIPACGTRLRDVVAHELAHLHRRDHLSAGMAELLCCLVPWQPLAWIARRRLTRHSEVACDQWALVAGAEPGELAETLLSLIPQPMRALAPAMAGTRREIAHRVHFMLRAGRREPRSGRSWRIAAAAVLLGLSVSTAVAHRRPARIDGSAESILVAQSSNQDADGASVGVFPNELDLGTAAPGLSGRGRIWLVNWSDQPAEMVSVKASCGCTTVIGFAPGMLSAGHAMPLDIEMTAPSVRGESKTKIVTFFIKGQPPLKLPVHVKTIAADTSP